MEPETTGKLEQQRVEKLEKIKALGIDPYGGRFDDVESSASIKERFVDDTEGQKACTAGRVVLFRDMGKLIFATVRDSSGTLQLGFSKKLCAEQWELINLIELGDIIGVSGQLGRTRTGEITIWVEQATMLSKSLVPPPEKFHGLSDVDLRYRQRYVDLWANP
jgi:lysyl-tRNA synthetase, class II